MAYNLGAYTKLLIRDADGTLTDVSDTQHSVSVSGNVVSSSTVQVFNQNTIYFPGNSGDYVRVPDSNDFHFSNYDFTLDAWIYQNTQTTSQYIFSQNLADSVSNNGIHLLLNTSGKLQLLIGNGSWTINILSTTTINTGTLYHVAAIRSGNNFSVAVNGSIEGTTSNSITITDKGTDFAIGVSSYNFSSGEFDGYIGQPRVIKKKALWTSNFTPPTAPQDDLLSEYTPLLIHSDYASSGDTFDPNDDFTGLDGDPPNTDRWIVDQGSPEIQNDKIRFTSADEDQIITTYKIIGDFDIQVDFSLVTYPSTTGWYAKFSAIIDGSTNRMSIYRGYTTQHTYACFMSNGGDTATYVSTSDTTGKFRITRVGSLWTGYYWTGSSWVSIDTNSTIGTGTVYLRLYTHKWSGNPTAVADFDNLVINSGTIITPTQLTIEDSSELNHNITSYGTYHSESVSKFGNSSLYFDGNSYASIPNHSSWDLADNDFTIDFWNRFETLDDARILSKFNVQTSQKSFMVFYSNTSNLLQFIYTTDGSTNIAKSASWTPSISTWYMITITRNGTDLRIFVDGVQIGSTENIGADVIFDSTTDVIIGGFIDSGGNISVIPKSYIDELRIINGEAKWTSNFTPPTRPYGEYYNSKTLYVNKEKVDENLTNFPAMIKIDETNYPDVISEILVGLDDTFSTFNTNRWFIQSGGDFVSIVSNTLDFDSDEPAITESYVHSRFKLIGDFDIQIDWEWVNLELSASSAYIQFGVQTEDDSDYITIRRERYTGQERMGVFGSSTPYTFITDTDLAGKYRLTRSGTTLKAYIWKSGQWEWNGNTAGYTYTNDLFTDNVYVRLRHRQSTANYRVHTQVDNFVVNSYDDIDFYDKKIKLYQDDQQCYIEKEYIDYFDRIIWLHTRIPSVSASDYTPLLLKWDYEKDDNINYVSETGEHPAQLVWDENYTAVYHMNSDPSLGAGTFLDSTEYENHGTPQGSMTSTDLIDEDPGKAIDFDGSDDIIRLGNDSSLSFAQNFTIDMIWRKKDPSTSAHRLISKGRTSPDHPRNYYIYTTNRVTFAIESTGDVYQGFSSNTEVYTGNQYYSSCLYDYNEGKSKIYMDGDFDNDKDMDPPYTNTADAIIGQIDNRTEDWIYHVVTETRLSKSVRSPEWIKSTYHSMFNDDFIILEIPVSGVGAISNLINGEWKSISSSRILVNGAWNQVAVVKILVNGEWKSVAEFDVKSYTSLDPNYTSGYITLSDENLKATSTYSASDKSTRSVLGVSSGKWYWEAYYPAAADWNVCGICKSTQLDSRWPGRDTNGWGYLSDTGNRSYNIIYHAYGDSWNSTGNYLMTALDMDNGKVWWGLNGVWQNSGDPANGTGEAYSGLLIYAPIYACYTIDDVNEYMVVNFGQSSFQYTPPTGFNAGLYEII